MAIIILSVIAVIVIQGWELGVTESISSIIAVGLSVDYVIHLSTHYQNSFYSSRNDKMRQAYGEMGVSVFSGTLTTAGSALFMFVTPMLTFTKFGVIILFVVLMSFVTSMVFFGAVCHTIGP